MNPRVYINGCNCGLNALYTARVRKLYPDLKVINTRVDKDTFSKHLAYSKQLGEAGNPLSIVVVNEKVTLLKDFNA